MAKIPKLIKLLNLTTVGKADSYKSTKRIPYNSQQLQQSLKVAEHQLAIFIS